MDKTDDLDIKSAPPESIIYQDDRLYVCLAHNPLTDNHTIVAWKDKVEDIHSLERDDYLHLMSVVESVRDALLLAFSLEKVYLLYADEAQHVHWHLVPRYEQKGMSILNHETKLISDFSNVAKIQDNLHI